MELHMRCDDHGHFGENRSVNLAITESIYGMIGAQIPPKQPPPIPIKPLHND
jgi:hypothetical protein